MINFREVIEEAFAVYGVEAQVRQFGEESSELFIELNRMLRGRESVSRESIAEEIADVQIMLEEFIQYLSADDEVEKIRRKKYDRLADRLGFDGRICYD